MTNAFTNFNFQVGTIKLNSNMVRAAHHKCQWAFNDTQITATPKCFACMQLASQLVMMSSESSRCRSCKTMCLFLGSVRATYKQLSWSTWNSSSTQTSKNSFQSKVLEAHGFVFLAALTITIPKQNVSKHSSEGKSSNIDSDSTRKDSTRHNRRQACTLNQNFLEAKD